MPMMRSSTMPRRPVSALALPALATALAIGPPAAAQPEGHAPATAAAPAAAAPHAGGAATNPLKPEPSLAIWTVVVFLGLLWVLGKFAWKPLREALHRRE